MRSLIHHLLREATQPYHDAIETNPYALKINSGELHQKDYISLLKAMYSFHLAVELELQKIDWSCGKSFFEQRKRAYTAENDLKTLGVDQEIIRSIPICNSAPSITSEAQAFGALYVLEGSTLGGQVIARMLQKSLGDSCDSAMSFYLGYAENTGVMWKKFCSELEHFFTGIPDSHQESAIAEMTGAAVVMFESLHQWLNNFSAQDVHED